MPSLQKTTLPEISPYYLATKDKTIVIRIMTDMTTKIIRYVRAWRCVLVNFVFPFAILFFL
jgi:hypothetical protein